MAKMTLKSILSDDRKTVTLELWDEEKPYAHIIYEAPEVALLIEQLAGHRAQMADEVVRELDPGALVRGTVDPVWVTQPTPASHPGGASVILRHPGLGWLGFLFPPNEAKKLGDWLLQSSQASKPDPSPKS